MLHKLWGGPPGPRGTPFVPLLPRESGPCRDEEPARGPAADQGVRPTTYASVRSWEKLVALGESPARAPGTDEPVASARRAGESPAPQRYPKTGPGSGSVSFGH